MGHGLGELGHVLCRATVPRLWPSAAEERLWHGFALAAEAQATLALEDLQGELGLRNGWQALELRNSFWSTGSVEEPLEFPTGARGTIQQGLERRAVRLVEAVLVQRQ